MDYEKKYKEALEKARMYRDNAKAVEEYSAVARYENIFPELREKPLTSFQQCLNSILLKVYYASVPGKVDKFILDIIKNRTDELVELAKRHEYTNCQLHKSKDEEIRQQLLWLCDEWEHNPERRTIPADIGNIKQIRRYLEKQKEQKPEIKYVYPKFRKGDVIEPITPNGHFTPVRVVDIWDGSYSCRSDDDKAYLSLPIKQEDEYRLVEPKHAPDDLQKSFEAGQTSIVDNPEQYGLCKKAEWSEEDESELTAVIYCVSRAIKASKDENERNSLLSAKKWLQDKLSFRVKSLRPSWKPSEEQMKGLKFFLDFHRPQRNAGTTNWREYDAVESLYEQIRKL